jgi:hypothetical protein
LEAGFFVESAMSSEPAGLLEETENAEQITLYKERIAEIEQANMNLSESRQKLVADITAERTLYEATIKRMEIKIQALTERMQPFLKQEEANTVAGQLKEWNKMHKNKTIVAQPKQQRKQKKRARRYTNKERQVLNPIPVVDSVATHLL